MIKRPAQLQKAYDIGAQAKRAGLGRDRLETNFSWMFNKAEIAAWLEGWQEEFDKFNRKENDNDNG